MGKSKKPRKEDICEDYCFCCKDGGLLMICDYMDCLKAYHPKCIGKDESFLQTSNNWICDWHCCFICHKDSKFQCYCCPKSLCKDCISSAQFALITVNKGFCIDCLKLAILFEEKVDYDSDGKKVDFKDRETFEFLFVDYWEIVREKEGLSIENLYSAEAILKKNKNMKSSFSFGNLKYDQNFVASDCDDGDTTFELNNAFKIEGWTQQKFKRNKHSLQRKAKFEFLGWGSRPLIEFLSFLKKDTNTMLTQYEVSSVINNYIRENNLFHPEKKKRVVCDAHLTSIFGRKTLNLNKIYALLEGHFSENYESPEEEIMQSSGEENEKVNVAQKRKRMLNIDLNLQCEEMAPAVQKCSFASFVPSNVKLVYMKKSLVEEMSKETQSFDDKVVGSFVRVKSDPNDYTQKHSHNLVQVTGVKRNQIGCGQSLEIVLQSTNVPGDIHFNMISDSDFSEEECTHLQQKVKDGLLKRPLIVELEEKARVLHRDITNHWIRREIISLQKQIDRANEKGWRRELFEYIERKQLLQTPAEQLRLLDEVPKVCPDLAVADNGSKENSKNRESGLSNQLSINSVNASSNSNYNNKDHGGDDNGIKKIPPSIVVEPVKENGEIIDCEVVEEEETCEDTESFACVYSRKKNGTTDELITENEVIELSDGEQDGAPKNEEIIDVISGDAANCCAVQEPHAQQHPFFTVIH